MHTILRLLVLALGPAVLAAAAGCGYVATGAGVGIAVLDDGGGSGAQAVDPPPLVLELDSEVPDEFADPNAIVDRPFDIASVPLKFILLEPSGEPADVFVEFALAGSGNFAPAILVDDPATADIDEGATTGLETSATGVDHFLRWNAAASGLSGLVAVDVRVRAEDGDGAGVAALIEGEVIGNEPPSATDPELRGPPRGNVVLAIRVDDSSGDPVSLSVRYRFQGEGAERSRPIFVTAGTLINLPPGLTSAIAWGSVQSDPLANVPPDPLPPPDLIPSGGIGLVDAIVIIDIVPDDGLPGGVGQPLSVQVELLNGFLAPPPP